MRRDGSRTICRNGQLQSSRPRTSTSPGMGCGCASMPISRHGYGDGKLEKGVDLQTGTFSGPVGSPPGTAPAHRRNVRRHGAADPQVVRTVRGTGRSAAACRRRSHHHAGVWLIGFEEDSPDDSGEICVVELFGDSIGVSSSELSIGVKAHHDPRLTDDMDRVPENLDAHQAGTRTHPRPGTPTRSASMSTTS